MFETYVSPCGWGRRNGGGIVKRREKIFNFPQPLQALALSQALTLTHALALSQALVLNQALGRLGGQP